MAPQSTVLGVDFGTTNSYFCKCPVDHIAPTGIDFGTGTDGLPTVVLYRDNKDPLVGYEGITEWGDATDQERQSYHLQTHFKPDIGSSREAEQIARDFLEGVVRLDPTRSMVHPSDQEIIFGTPSEADSAFKSTIVEIAKKAGYGSVQVRDEPVGALMYHLWNKDLSPSDAHKGVLVVDFGGGTCDFAYMLRLNVRHSWGDMLLGGRLFDDLFFQWFTDENPGAAEALEASGDEYFVHWDQCREMKESFSQTMARNRDETVRKRIGNYGAVTGMSWESFVGRAKSYRPSTSFIRYLREVGDPAERLTDSDKGIDLIEWFRSSLAAGLDDGKVDKGQIDRVVLAGGSSLWPFVPEIVSEVLEVDLSAVLRTERPYAVVATGLAILPAFQREFGQRRECLRGEKAAFLKGIGESLLVKRTKQVGARITKGITAHLYDGEIRAILKDFREHGGTIADVKRKISAAVEGSGGELREITDRHVGLLGKGLPEELQERVSEWFSSHGLFYTPRSAKVEATEALGDVEIEGPDLLDGMTANLTTATAVITGAVVGSICGGAGLALIMSGPIGWAIGAIIGFASIFIGREAVRDWVESKELSPGMAQFILSEDKMTKILKEGREKFKEAISGQVSACCEQPVQDLLGKIEENVDKEIECLTAIDQI